MNETATWPPAIAALSRDQHGRPIPLSFVLGERGLQERDNWRSLCFTRRLCWVCGRALTDDSGFLMTAPAIVASIARDPPAHAGCVRFPLQRITLTHGLMALWITYEFRHYEMGAHRRFGMMVLRKAKRIEWFLPKGWSQLDAFTELNAAADRQRALLAEATPAARADSAQRIAAAMSLLRRGI